MKKKKASEDTGLGRWLRSPELGHTSMIPFGKEMKEQVQQLEVAVETGLWVIETREEAFQEQVCSHQNKMLQRCTGRRRLRAVCCVCRQTWLHRRFRARQSGTWPRPSILGDSGRWK